MMSLFTLQQYSEAIPVQPVERPSAFEFSIFTPVYFIIAKFMEFVSAEVRGGRAGGGAGGVATSLAANASRVASVGMKAVPKTGDAIVSEPVM